MIEHPEGTMPILCPSCKGDGPDCPMCDGEGTIYITIPGCGDCEGCDLCTED